MILACSIFGILGSYGVAWFGIRINTTANSRTAFASLRGNPLKTLFIPLQAGMSIGLLLICVELACMIAILAFIPDGTAGPCFIGFAIGESLGASALRIGGGIFTKIADIGSDLMKIVFNLPEDDPKNPGVIADCTGDNAGDSVGPTADGFETYGVTGVALIAFLALALALSPLLCAQAHHLDVCDPGADGAGVARLVLFQHGRREIPLRRRKRISTGKRRSRTWSGSPASFPSSSASARASCCSAILQFRKWSMVRRRKSPLPNLWWVLSCHHRLRHARRRAHHGVHENFRQHQVAPRPGNHRRLRPRRRVAERPLRPRRGKFLRVLDGPRHSRR